MVRVVSLYMKGKPCHMYSVLFRMMSLTQQKIRSWIKNREKRLFTNYQLSGTEQMLSSVEW